MTAISQPTLSNAFSWIKMYELPLKFHLSKFVLNGPINNIPALVQIMAWRRPGDKPLFKPMMVRLSTHIRVTRLQWFKPKPHEISVILPRSVPNFKAIGLIKGMLWTNEISRDLSLRWVSDTYPILDSTPEHKHNKTNHRNTVDTCYWNTLYIIYLGWVMTWLLSDLYNLHAHLNAGTWIASKHNFCYI